MTKRNDSVVQNEQGLVRDLVGIKSEESLAEVMGGAGLNIIKVVGSIPNRVRTPDLNLTPVVPRTQGGGSHKTDTHSTPPSPTRARGKAGVPPTVRGTRSASPVPNLEEDMRGYLSFAR